MQMLSKRKYGIVIISDKTGFRGENISVDRKGLLWLLKVFNLENFNLKFVCTFNIYNTSKYIMKRLTKLEEKLEKSIILGDFSAQLSVPYRRYKRQTIWLKNLAYRANVKYCTQQSQKHFMVHIYRNWPYTCSYSKS